MKVKEDTVKVVTYSLIVTDEEARAIRAAMGEFNSINQNVTVGIWEALGKAGIPNDLRVTTSDGERVPTLQLEGL